MSTAVSSGGTSLAPTPTHPHQLSQEPSQEDIEMAENLNMLNHAQDRHAVTRDPKTRNDTENEGQAATSPGNDSGISEYHSLDDTLHFQQTTQSEQSPGSTSTPNMPNTPQPSNAPITGQICR